MCSAASEVVGATGNRHSVTFAVLRADRGRQHKPSLCVLSPCQRFGFPHQTIASLFLRLLRLGRASPTSTLGGGTVFLDTIMQARGAPWLRATPSSALASAFIVEERRLSIRRTGKPSGFNTPDVLRHGFRCLALGSGIRGGLLLGQLTRVHHDKPALLLRHPSIGICHLDAAHDTLALPTSGRIP